jgi:hypothetical protein
MKPAGRADRRENVMAAYIGQPGGHEKGLRLRYRRRIASVDARRPNRRVVISLSRKTPTPCLVFL